MDRAEDLTNVTIHATLEGGPADLPPSERTRRTTAANNKIKVRHGAAYEHFEPTGESVTGRDGEVRVYRWTMRTRIAE